MQQQGFQNTGSLLKALELIVLRSPTLEGYQSKDTLTEGMITPLAFPDLDINDY